MRNKLRVLMLLVVIIGLMYGEIGKRFPSERKVIRDPVTNNKLIFLTNNSVNDSRIYPTHPQWTSDGNWVIFRSERVPGEAMAVNEKTGRMVQVTEGGYTGRLNIAHKSMKLYFMRKVKTEENQKSHLKVIELDLAKLFEDSKTGNVKSAQHYETVCGTIPDEFGGSHGMALDANENWMYFRLTKKEAAKHLADSIKIKENFGPRDMGAGPGGIGKLNLNTGELKHVVSVPFQVGHIQANTWKSGEIIFCWETGGKSPQRSWVVNADGSGLRPLYPESKYEWVTHEAVINENEVAMAIMGHRPIDTKNSEESGPGQEKAWGPSGTREKPTGLAIVNLRTREMNIVGQIPFGSGFWHVHGSPDGRWAVGDNFSRSVYLIDRIDRETMLLSTGHKRSAENHVHPSFSRNSKKIIIQSAMLSEDGSMDICVIPVPDKWLNKTYKDLPEKWRNKIKSVESK